jgi:hypothetical protein
MSHAFELWPPRRPPASPADMHGRQRHGGESNDYLRVLRGDLSPREYADRVEAEVRQEFDRRYPNVRRDALFYWTYAVFMAAVLGLIIGYVIGTANQ